MSEKIGGVEGTKFTEEYTVMERVIQLIFWRNRLLIRFYLQKTDLTNELVDDLLNKTKEYLQPNPGDYFHWKFFSFTDF